MNYGITDSGGTAPRPRWLFPTCTHSRAITNVDIESAASAPIATVNPPKSAEATGLVQGALDGQNEDGDNDDSEAEGGIATNLKSNRETSDGMYFERIIVYIAY